MAATAPSGSLRSKAESTAACSWKTRVCRPGIFVNISSGYLAHSMRTKSMLCGCPAIPYKRKWKRKFFSCKDGRDWDFRAAKKSQSRSEEHTSELQSHVNLVCRLLLEK